MLRECLILFHHFLLCTRLVMLPFSTFQRNSVTSNDCLLMFANLRISNLVLKSSLVQFFYAVQRGSGNKVGDHVPVPGGGDKDQHRSDQINVVLLLNFVMLGLPTASWNGKFIHRGLTIQGRNLMMVVTVMRIALQHGLTNSRQKTNGVETAQHFVARQ